MGARDVLHQHDALKVVVPVEIPRQPSQKREGIVKAWIDGMRILIRDTLTDPTMGWLDYRKSTVCIVQIHP